MAYIFVDESGQFAKHQGSEHFVVGSFAVGNPHRTEKRFRSWQRRKFPRRMRNQAEIKWSAVRISDDLRLRTLKYIADLDVRIRYSYLRRANIPETFRKKGRVKAGPLYTHVIGETVDSYLPITEKEFRLFCDKRHLKGITHADFKKQLKARFLPQLPSGALVQIEMVDSTQSANIQIADWLTGALAWYLEGKPLGCECYAILKNNLLGEGLELFPDYWQERFENQKTQPDG